MQRHVLRCLTGIVVFFQMAPLCEAQSSAAADQQTIRELAQEIKELQEKVALLESKQASHAADPANDASQQSAQERPLASDLDSRNFRGIQWRGFGEVDYKVLDQRTPELGTSGFVPGSA